MIFFFFFLKSFKLAKSEFEVSGERVKLQCRELNRTELLVLCRETAAGEHGDGRQQKLTTP